MPQTPDPHPDEPTPPIKEFALVGQFFFQWSYMEAMITNHIRDLLGFRSIEGSIVLANVAFRDKVNILATLVELQMRKRGKEGKAENQESVQRPKEPSSRNFLAHTPFIPRSTKSGGGLEFIEVKAKGRYQVPKTVWRVTDFQARFAEMDELEERLTNVIARYNQQLSNNLLAQALFAPTRALESLDDPDRQSPLLERFLV